MTTFNIEPFTHTGAIATYSMSDETELYGGWTPGWGTGFDQLHRGNCFLGGFSTSLWDNIALAYTSTAGEPGWRGNGYSHSIVLDFTVTDKLSYVPQNDMVRTNDHDGNPATFGRNDDFGINQYLIYQINDTCAVGTRVEWWRNEGISQYAVSFGVNLRPKDNLVFRPEIRHDWDTPVVGSNTSVGMDAILTY